MDSWDRVTSQLALSAVLEARLIDANGHNHSRSLSASLAGAQLMAWRLLTKGVKPHDGFTISEKPTNERTA